MKAMPSIRKEADTCVNPLAESRVDHYLLRPWADLTPEHPVSIVAYAHGPGSWQAEHPAGIALPRQVTPLLAPHAESVKAHGHDYCELGFVVAGIAQHFTEHGRFDAAPGTVHFVPLRQVHAFEKCRAWYIINVCYLAEWVVDDLRTVRREESLLALFLSPELFMKVCYPAAVNCALDPDEWALCMAEIDNIAAEQARPKPSYMFVRACLQKLLLTIARGASREYSGHPGLELPPVVWRAVGLIEERVLRSEPVSIERLAKELGFSESHFARQFRQAMGRTPKEYLQIRRIQYACKLLLNPAYSITDVAMNLGFATGAHFSNIFRKYRGVPPREYRRKYAAAHNQGDS